MDSMNPWDLLKYIPKIFETFTSMGPVGMALAAAIAGGIIWIIFKLKSIQNAAAQKETDQKREDASAKNPLENKKDEDDMAKGDSKIENILKE